ncbi:ASCH domain-containing protein [Halobacillus salinarum]|uniref:ASCH domain-containing protein n=1 Tax=Halobacillus salinarum TaxID=2932257 RepID=A0ABY4EGG6_9BACI|nr:ASCH domain-containing protein [Halobacillus salinarum]UOQ43566.1 ASCH domain-containing protein [Halobacillus salinarum]
MIHFMGLNENPFQLIRQGDKLYEIRLNDTKRKRLRKGDQIEFTCLPDKRETLLVDILDLRTFVSFDQLFKTIPKEDLAKENCSHEELLNSTYQIYTKEQENKWGALAIQISLSSRFFPLRTIFSS